MFNTQLSFKATFGSVSIQLQKQISDDQELLEKRYILCRIVNSKLV